MDSEGGEICSHSVSKMGVDGQWRVDGVRICCTMEGCSSSYFGITGWRYHAQTKHIGSLGVNEMTKLMTDEESAQQSFQKIKIEGKEDGVAISNEEHRNQVHFGERWRCNVCDYEAAHKGNLKRRCGEHFSEENITHILPQTSSKKRKAHKYMNDEEDVFESTSASFSWNAKEDLQEGISDILESSSSLTCNLCGRTCSTSGSLLLHKNGMHFGAHYTCNVCGADTRFKGNLKRKCKNHFSEESPVLSQFSKDNITYTPPNRQLVSGHKKINQNKIEQELSEEDETSSDSQEDKPNPGTLQCTICGKEISTPTNLRSHLNAMHHGERWTCNICGNSSPWRFNLKKKCGPHFSENELTYLPPNPNNIQNAPEEEEEEEKAEDRASKLSGSFYCRICGQKTSSAMNLRLHENTMHFSEKFMGHLEELHETELEPLLEPPPELALEQEPPEPLEEVEEMPQPSEKIKSPKEPKTHPDNNKQSFVASLQCKICGKEISSAGNLRVHENTMHFGEKWTCNLCGYSSPWKFCVKNNCKEHFSENELTHIPPNPNHIVDNHTEKAKHPNSDEGRQKRNRKKSKKFDEDEDDLDDLLSPDDKKKKKRPKNRAVQCDLCGKFITSAINLLKHENTIHYGEKWTCHICGYSSPWKQCVKDNCRQHYSEEQLTLTPPDRGNPKKIKTA